MTKPLVQGQIGYWVNGELVHMPKRRGTKRLVHNHVKRNKQWKQHVALQRKIAQTTTNSKSKSKISVSIPSNIMEDLKNASKTGNIMAVLRVQEQILTDCIYLEPSAWGKAVKTFPRIVKVLFTHDIEERTALYYAAHSGHTNLVRFYLGLYIIGRAMSNVNFSKIQSGDMAQRRETFRGWFDNLKFMPWRQFQEEDYDVCVLNALSEEVRFLMTKNKIQLSQILDMTEAAIRPLDLRWAAKMTKATKTGELMNDLIYTAIERVRGLLGAAVKQDKKGKKKRPALKIDNDLDLVVFGNYEYYDFYEESYYLEETDDEDHAEIPEMTNPSPSGSLFTENQDESKPEPSTLTPPDSNVLTEISSACGEYVTIEFNPDEEEEWEDIPNDPDSTSVDYSLLSLPESVKLGNTPKEEEEMKEEDASDMWDVVSDVKTVQSIASIGTFNEVPVPEMEKLSYRDAVLVHTKKMTEQTTNRCNASCVVSRKDDKLDTKEKMSPPTTVDSELIESEVDPEFHRNLVKDTRGGKDKLKFRGQLRTDRHAGYARSWTRQENIESKLKVMKQTKTDCKKIQFNPLISKLG